VSPVLDCKLGKTKKTNDRDSKGLLKYSKQPKSVKANKDPACSDSFIGEQLKIKVEDEEYLPDIQHSKSNKQRTKKRNVVQHSVTTTVKKTVTKTAPFHVKIGKKNSPHSSSNKSLGGEFFDAYSWD
jgi:hypothetical protein